MKRALQILGGKKPVATVSGDRPVTRLASVPRGAPLDARSLSPAAPIRGFVADEESGEPTIVDDQEFVGQADAGADAAPDAAAPPADAGPVPDAGAAPVPAAPVPGAPAPPAAAGAAACVVTNTATVHAPDGTPDTRTTIGVNETISFSAGGQVADWTADSGWPAARGVRATFLWAAPEQPGTSRITATIPATGQTCSIDMTVVAPASIRMTSFDEQAFPAGSAGASMRLIVRVHPRNVNFGWVSLLEDPGPAAGVTGYFAARQAAGVDLSHHPNPNFTRFQFNNTIRFDSAFVRPAAVPAPWSDGAFHWNIPNRYRAFNSTGAGTIFTTTVQRFAIDAAGTVTITKQGARVVRSP